MSIVIELQQEALKSDTDIVVLLRKAYFISRKLGLSEFGEWVNNELNGYQSAENVPKYRRVRGELKGLNPYYGWIPVVITDTGMEELVNIKKIVDSIPSLNSLLGSSNKEFTIGINGSCTALLSEFTGFETTYKLFVPFNSISNILEQVKTSILEWAIVLEENNILGEELRFTAEEKAKAQNEPGIVNYISNFWGSVTETQVQQGTKDSTQKVNN